MANLVLALAAGTPCESSSFFIFSQGPFKTSTARPSTSPKSASHMTVPPAVSHGRSNGTSLGAAGNLRLPLPGDARSDERAKILNRNTVKEVVPVGPDFASSPRLVRADFHGPLCYDTFSANHRLHCHPWQPMRNFLPANPPAKSTPTADSLQNQFGYNVPAALVGGISPANFHTDKTQGLSVLGRGMGALQTIHLCTEFELFCNEKGESYMSERAYSEVKKGRDNG